jgi:hypothetical protein
MAFFLGFFNVWMAFQSQKPFAGEGVRPTGRACQRFNRRGLLAGSFLKISF